MRATLFMALLRTAFEDCLSRRPKGSLDLAVGRHHDRILEITVVGGTTQSHCRLRSSNRQNVRALSRIKECFTLEQKAWKVESRQMLRGVEHVR